MHHAARTEDIGDGPPQPVSAIDDEQQRPVRRQSARHQVAQQAGGDGSGLGGAFAQAQHVFPALCVNPQCDHHAVVPEDLAVDADHPQVQLAQRPAEKRLEAPRRQPMFAAIRWRVDYSTYEFPDQLPRRLVACHEIGRAPNRECEYQWGL